MEQPENLTLAEGAQTTPNFDFLLAPRRRQRLQSTAPG